jgi:tetratricopeptide (TPR) repeat protein
VDSQFFSQFEVINELAQEGFLFRENLVENIFGLWKEYEGLFDVVFQNVLESITQRKSKIYDERENWELFWHRERENFDRDYLYVVEGNLSYANGRFDDALLCYEKALRLNPELRSARLNITFCYAQLGRKEEHRLAAQKIANDRTLQPASLFVAGDSYLLLGDEARADEYYRTLSKDAVWERKVDYYKSTFCYENRLFRLAVKYAEQAHRLNHNDTSMSYHLSLCYNAVGEKDHALDMVKRMPEAPEWLNYYRFTLERDSGRHHEASHTLLQIPNEYFQDPDELEAALDFAKLRQDLVLLRHLRRKD